MAIGNTGAFGLKLTVHLRPEHYRHFLRVLLGGAADGKIQQSHFPDFVPVVMVSLIATLGIAHGLLRLRGLPVSIFSIALGVILGWAALTVLRRMQERAAQRKFFPDAADPVFVPTEYQFEEAGFRSESDHGWSFTRREAIRRLYEDDVMFVLLQSNQQGFIFPKDQLSQEQAQALRRWYERQVIDLPEA